MDASNPLSVAQAASPNLPTVPSPLTQAGAITSTAAQTPEATALMPPAALQYQFNIQQSLLMQQYALAQQAAVKAATVKSAAEIAAARAAEISKQLEKKSQSSSTSKSTSHSPEQSKSKSRSRSRSHSPIRKRRARSISRSPIRYRRDYHSPYRPREHYGYRGYNYRNYYRGSYNDYSRYRYGREPYRRRSRSGERRRSRTRSRSPRRDRSRGRRRSPSLSPPPKNRSQTRSPRDLQKKSGSPHASREGTMSRRQSASREAVRSPSVSSRSITSPPSKNRSRSSSQVKTYEEDRSPSTELSHGTDEEQRVFVDRKPKGGSSVSSHLRMQSLSSTARSLSVSLDNKSNGSASDKGATEQRSSDGKREIVKLFSSDDHKETYKRISSDELASPGERYNGKLAESEGRTKEPGEGHRIRKPTQSPNAIFHGESESSDETLDDWRDDLKQVVKGKGFSTFKDEEPDGVEDRGRSEMDSSVRTITSDMEPKHELIECASPEHSDSAVAVREQDVVAYEGYGPVIVRGDEESLLEERRHDPVLENAKEVCLEGGQCEQALDDYIIFEGPKPASPVNGQKMQGYEGGGMDIDGHFIDEKSPGVKRSDSEMKITESLRIAEDDKYHTKDSNRRHSHEKKLKYRSRSRDGKKYEGELSKHEKRRDRHKKHRKKHRNVVEESAERDRSQRRHKRKHKRVEEHGNKERKKQKRKHRTRSSSISVDDSTSASEDEVRNSRRRKRGFKKHKTGKRDVIESPPPSASLG